MKVFISHISEESPLALELKDWIESSFAGQCQVFVSSDQDSIPAGSKWLDKIDEALKGATVFIVLCSSSSLSRPWVNFETGCAWMQRVPLIPICHSGQKRAALPAPISAFQALELEDKDFVNQLLSSVTKYFGFTKVPRIDENRMKKQLLRAAGKIKTEPADQKDSSETAADEIPAEAIEILKVMGKISGEENDPTALQLAHHFNMPEQRMQYYLDLLDERKLIHYSLYMGARRRTILGKKAESFFFTKDFCKVTDDKIRSLTLSSFLLGRLRGPVTALPNWQSIRI